MLDPICVYKTPCGWCSKWDKECNRKIGYLQGKLIKTDKTIDEKTLKEYSKE